MKKCYLKMKIIAGLGYDGRLPNNPPELLGIKICGEYSLISELEFRAGQPEYSDSKASRVISYLNALKLTDNGKRFYSTSFQTDPIASAETLLYWRDWAILHGWQYDKRSSNPERLDDLAAVEKNFIAEKLSLGERIYKILLSDNLIAHAISEVILHAPRTNWPPLFQMLFNKLELDGVIICETSPTMTPSAEAHTDLGKLQQALISGDTKSLNLMNDGSIRLFKTSNRQNAAQYVSQLASKQNCIIASGHHHCIETAVLQLINTSTGLGSLSSSRAPNHLLQLILQCSWFTPSAEVVLQYLTLPAGKFRRLRRHIARCFKDLPGYDINKWQEIIDKYVADELKTNPECDELALRLSISEWLPISTCDNDDEMPIKHSLVLTERIANYWKSRSATSTISETKEIFIAAFNSAEATANSLRNWPDTTINKAQLNRLISMVRELGKVSWYQAREVNEFDIIQTPEAALLRVNDIDNLIWIDPVLSSGSTIPPFSRQELAAIPFALTNQQQSEFQQFDLMRAYSAILAAKKTVTFIAIDNAPDLLKLLLCQLTGVDDWRSLEDAILCNQEIATSSVAITEITLPKASRWWEIDKPLASLRHTESYSSLSSLVLKPHEYTLRYPARISEGSIIAVSVDSRLKGMLAHKVVEKWLIDQPWNGIPVKRNDISEWLEKNLISLIHQMALPLAQPGMHVERLQFQQKMLNAMDKLFVALITAKVTAVFSELRLEYQDAIGKIEGVMDILCEFANGDFAVIDMKWGGYQHYLEEIKSGRPLQLATYAYIAQKNRQGTLLDAGYFILSDAVLLCNHNKFFPTAITVGSDTPVSLKDTWNRFERTIQWRKTQLQQGCIEITQGLMLSDARSAPPDNTLPLCDMEDAHRLGHRNNYQKKYKPIDIWRNLTGNFKE
jgi:ATP-dependent helicase/nuclease subunit B